MNLPINRFSSQKVTNHTYAVISKVILPDKILNLFKYFLSLICWIEKVAFQSCFSFVFLCLNFILVPFDLVDKTKDQIFGGGLNDLTCDFYFISQKY